MILTRVRFSDFAGRATESALLLRAFQRACDGHGSLVLIQGQAGIGKTTLVARLAKDVRAQGGRFVRTGCYPYLRRPYAPVRQAIRELTGSDLPPRRSKYETFVAVWETLKKAAAHAPLALAIDDIQWADRATLEVLDFLASHIDGERACIVCAHRDDDDNASPSTVAAISRIGQIAKTRVRLGPLTVAEARAIFEPSLREFPALRRIALDEIVHRAGGNPLFIEEMLVDFVQRGGETSHLIPGSVRGDVGKRLQRTSPAARRLVEFASMFGSECRVEDLLAVSNAQPNALGIVGSALRTGLLTQRSPTQLAFRHTVIRDFVYDGLSTANARLGHAAIARRFEERGEPAASVAHHWVAAGDEAQAATWTERAGDEALQAFAYADAAQFFRRAAQTTATARDRPRLREKAGLALQIDGHVGAAMREFTAAADLYRELGQSEDRLRMAILLTAVASLDVGYPASKRASRVAIAEAKRLMNPDLACNAFATSADHLRIAGHLRRADVLLGRASHFVSNAQMETIARFHDVAGKTAVGRLDNAAADYHFAISRRSAEATDNVAIIIRVASNQADFAQRTLDYERALEIWSDIYRLAKQRVFGWRISFAQLGLADILVLKGELSKAEALVEQAIERGFQCEALRLQAANVGTRLGILLGREDLIERCAKEATLQAALRIRDSGYLSVVAAAFVELALARGDVLRAESVVLRYCATVVGTMLSERMLPFVGQFGSDDDFAHAERVLAGMPPYLDLLHAKRAKRLCQPLDAHIEARAAEAQFSTLGLTTLAAQARKVAEDRTTAAAPFRNTRQHDNTLTPREREICAEVAHGDSNREIAERLGISIKTVGHHLESIYARLGLDGRAKLVAYLNATRMRSGAETRKKCHTSPSPPPSR